MVKIFLIQFRTDKSLLHERECFKRYLRKDREEIKIEAVSIFDKNLDFYNPQKQFEGACGFLLGGSGEFSFSDFQEKPEDNFWTMIERVESIIEYAVKKEIPLLGVCFGGQVLGHFLGVEIVNDKAQTEVGSIEIFLTKEAQKDPLFKDLPEIFWAQAGHKDSLKNLPQEALLLASSRRCKVHGFRYKKNIYGILFHPELTLEDILFRLKLYPDYAKDKGMEEIKKRLKPSPLPPLLLRNFGNIVSKSKRGL